MFDTAVERARDTGRTQWVVWTQPWDEVEPLAWFEALPAEERFFWQWREGGEAIAAHGDLSADIPAGPPYYRFADAAESRRAVESAGFKGARVHEVAQVWRLADPDHVLIEIADGTVRSGALFRAQTPSVRCAIAVAVRDAVQAYDNDGVIELPMPAVLTSATKLI